jgi:Co/Zn/Cd efflux system component
METNTEIIKDTKIDVKQDLTNSRIQETGDLTKLREKVQHTESKISNIEKEIIKGIKKKKEENQKKAIKKLIVVSAICIFFMVVELVGNYLSGSLAILSDALHMLSDFSGFAISMSAMIISRRKPTEKLSYGYHRAEVIGALLSVILIWGLTGWLVYEAVERCRQPEIDLDPVIMLVVAIIGLICNIIMGHTLHSVVRLFFNILGWTSSPWTFSWA